MRPVGVPEKFWDKATGTIRVAELVKSYTHLERLLGAKSIRIVALETALREAGVSFIRLRYGTTFIEGDEQSSKAFVDFLADEQIKKIAEVV